MPYKEKKIEKLYYSISEVAEIFDVSQSLIRYWEGEFDLLHPRKNSKGNRMFTQKDIQNFRVIYHLVKEKGFTLEGARNKLKENVNVTDDTIDLEEVIVKLKEIRKFLEGLHDIL